MSFVGDIVGGVASIFSGATTSAPKINTKDVTKSFSTPFYGLNKGKLTPTANAASPLGFRNMLAGLQDNQLSLAGLRSSLAPVQNTLSGVSGNLSSLYGELRPGFGRLTQSRVQAVRDAAAQSIGDLRSQLSRRSVLGSSFGNDAEARTQMAFAQEEEKARAESIIQEVGLSTEIIQKQLATQALTLGVNEADRAILAQSAQNYIAQANTLGQEITAEMNQLGMAGQLSNQVSQIVMQGAVQQAQLDMLQQNINNAAIVGGIQSIFGGGNLLGKSPTTITGANGTSSIGGSQGLFGSGGSLGGGFLY